jgi:hypothetical protein
MLARICGLFLVGCGKACGIMGYSQRKKKGRKKERNENRPMEKRKTQKARFPLSHRACYQRRRKT